MIDAFAQEVVSGVKNVLNQSLWEYLAALPNSTDGQIFAALLLSGTVGMFAHFVLKCARGDIRGGLFEYIAENWTKAALSFITFIGLASFAVANNVFFGIYGGFVGWKVVLWMGMTNGFFIDAIVNKTRRAEWTLGEYVQRVGGKTDDTAKVE